MEHIFRTETIVPAPLERVFPFFADAKNLERITPPWLNFRILSQSTPEIGEGTLFTYALRIKKFPVRWITRIEEWNPPFHFVDNQIKGPYRLWHHTHRFEARGNQTWMEDVVRYEIPFGALGRLLAGRMIAKDVAEIFECRRSEMLNYFRPTS